MPLAVVDEDILGLCTTEGDSYTDINDFCELCKCCLVGFYPQLAIGPPKTRGFLLLLVRQFHSAESQRVFNLRLNDVLPEPLDTHLRLSSKVVSAVHTNPHAGAPLCFLPDVSFVAMQLIATLMVSIACALLGVALFRPAVGCCCSTTALGFGSGCVLALFAFFQLLALVLVIAIGKEESVAGETVTPRTTSCLG